MPDIDRQWYWDRRSNKAYYPVEADDETVELVSVWHREEVEGALESGALVSADEIDVLEHLEGPDGDSGYPGSFRLPDGVGPDSSGREAAPDSGEREAGTDSDGEEAEVDSDGGEAETDGGREEASTDGPQGSKHR